MAIGGFAYAWKKFLGIIVSVFTYPKMIKTLLGSLFFMKNNREAKVIIAEPEKDYEEIKIKLKNLTP